MSIPQIPIPSQSFECPWCDPDDFTSFRCFDSINDLAQHRDIEHPGRHIYVCSACDQTFNDYDEACEHVQDEHDEYCDECQQNYIYEAIYVSPEVKNRINEIHDKIRVLREELETLTTYKGPLSVLEGAYTKRLEGEKIKLPDPTPELIEAIKPFAYEIAPWMKELEDLRNRLEAVKVWYERNKEKRRPYEKTPTKWDNLRMILLEGVSTKLPKEET